MGVGRLTEASLSPATPGLQIQAADKSARKIPTSDASEPPDRRSTGSHGYKVWMLTGCESLWHDSEAVAQKTALLENWSLYSAEARPGVKVKDVLSFVLVHFLRSKKGNCLRRQNFLYKLSRTFRSHLNRVVKHQGRINMLVRTRRNDAQRRYFKQVFRLELKQTLGRSPAQVQRRLETTLVPLFLNIVFGFEGSLELDLSTEQQDEICERLGLSIYVPTPGLLEAFRCVLQPELTKCISADPVVLKLLSSKRQMAIVARPVTSRPGEPEEEDMDLEEETPLSYEESTLPETAGDTQDDDPEGSHEFIPAARYWAKAGEQSRTFCAWHLSAFEDHSN